LNYSFRTFDLCPPRFSRSADFGFGGGDAFTIFVMSFCLALKTESSRQFDCLWAYKHHAIHLRTARQGD
jgi:hypothetical protein